MKVVIGILIGILAVLVIIVLIVLILYGISWLGAGLAGPLGEFVVWLGQQWPGSHESAPYFVLIIIFLSFHLLLTPYYLKLARYASGRNDLGRALSKDDLYDRMVGINYLLAAGDSVFLFLLTRTVHSIGDWPAASSKLMKLPGGFLWLCLLPFGLIIVDIIATILSLFVAKKNFAMLAKIVGFQVPPPMSGWDSDYAMANAVVQGILIYYPVFICLWITFPKGDLLFTMIVCFLLTKVVTRGFFEIVSLAVDSRRKRESDRQG